MASLGEGKRGGKAAQAAADDEDVQLKRSAAPTIQRNSLGWGQVSTLKPPDRTADSHLRRRGQTPP